MNKVSAPLFEKSESEMEMESDASSFYPVTFSVSKRPTLRQRFEDSKPVVLIGLAVFAIAFIVPTVAVFLGGPLWLLSSGNSFLFTFSIFMIGMLTAGTAVLSLRLFSRTMLNGNQKKIKELENRLRSGSPEVVADLDALITEHLKSGRPQVAEYYSKQLMSLCENSHQQDVIIPDLMITTRSWVSRPEYHKSWNYFAVWMFESTGLLCLTKDHLEYESTRLSFRVDLKDIVDIGVDHHPRWMKPYPLRFIKITFNERDFNTVSTFNVTPFMVHTDTVWDINKNVAEWYNDLTKALQKI
jgi:hypothetical protein